MNIPKNGLVKDASSTTRCFWGSEHDDYRAYHDSEWGHPVADEHRLFEKICLEGFQAGLSWLTILRKRENFRKAFRNFDYHKVARFTTRRVEILLQDAGIVRHRGKIESTINNAKHAVEMEREFGSLSSYFWQYEPESDSRPKKLTWKALQEMSTSEESKALSKDLKKRGWSFVGPTTAYAFMQAMGMVNDHVEGCAYRESVEKARKKFKRPG